MRFIIASLFVICSLSLSAQKKDSLPKKDSVQVLVMNMEALAKFAQALDGLIDSKKTTQELLKYLEQFVIKVPAPAPPANKPKQ